MCQSRGAHSSSSRYCLPLFSLCSSSVTVDGLWEDAAVALCLARSRWRIRLRLRLASVRSCVPSSVALHVSWKVLHVNSSLVALGMRQQSCSCSGSSCQFVGCAMPQRWFFSSVAVSHHSGTRKLCEVIFLFRPLVRDRWFQFFELWCCGVERFRSS